MNSPNEKVISRMQQGAYGQEDPNMIQSSQPAAHAGMSTTNARNAKNLPLTASGERKWSNGLFGCFADTPTCLLAWCCPCMAYSKNKSRYESLTNSNQPHPSGGDSFSGDCAIHCCITYLTTMGCFLTMMNRKNIRQRYSIDSNGCTDCCVSWCCHPCALTQEARELELEEDVLYGRPIGHKA